MAYKLRFSGELLDGVNRLECIEQLAELFHKDRDWIESRLFSGRTLIIKSVEDADIARRYLTLFREAGALLDTVPPLNDEALLPVPQSSAPQRDNERRARKQGKREMERDLNDEQLVALRNLEHFGWELKFLRRPLFQKLIPVVYDLDSNQYAVLEEDGTLNEDHDLVIRD